MKILLTVHQFFPRHYHGTERHTLDLAKALQSRGHSVVVLTRTDHIEDLDGQDWSEYIHEGIRVLAVDMVTHADSSFEGSFERKDLEAIYGEILCVERPDVIHCCHLSYLGANFISVAARIRVPTIVSFTDFFGICWTNRLQKVHGGLCRGPDVDGLNCIQDVLRSVQRPYEGSILNFLYSCLVRTRLGVQLIRWSAQRRWLNSAAVVVPMRGIQRRNGCLSAYYHQAALFITATSYLRNAYIRAGYPVEKVLMMPFGIAQPDLAEVRRLRERYSTLASSARPLIIGFIGQIAKHKGLLDVFEAFRRGAFPNTLLHVYGDMKQDPKFAELVHHEVDRNPKIALLGTFPGGEIYRKLAEIDVLVVASTWAENSPLVLLNALASRTMVIVTKVEGMCDLIEDGVNGHLVAPCDPDDMARKLSSVVKDRRHLLSWYDGPFKSYSTSPLDYAVQIESIYTQKLAEVPERPRYRREDFQARLARKVVLTCKRLREPADGLEMFELTAASWRFAPHLMAIENHGNSTRFRAEATGAHLLIERRSDLEGLQAAAFFVRWPRSGVTVIYYATETDPEFSERQKVVQVVAADVWCLVSIRFPGGGADVLRVRWDPLHDSIGLPVEIASACPAK